MARIRTIKPEFPQSESMGNISRDARLAFIMVWTLADDEGRLRGNSRMLASLLFPYDDDAPVFIDKWIAELEQEGCVIRYKMEGQTYLQVCNWLNHQKIDKPSKSKIPEFDGTSRILANPRECSLEDQGSRIKDQGSVPSTAVDGQPSTVEPARPKKQAAAIPPTPDAVKEEIWAVGRRVLEGAGMNRDKAGGFLGGLIKDYGQKRVLEVVRDAALATPAEPSAWMVAACQERAAKSKKPSPHQLPTPGTGAYGKTTTLTAEREAELERLNAIDPVF